MTFSAARGVFLRGFQRGVALLRAVFMAVFLVGCASRPAPSVPDAGEPPSVPEIAQPAPEPPAPEPAPALGSVAGRGERLLVYVPRGEDSLAGIAKRFLGSTERAWQIAEINGDITQPTPGVPLVVPLAMPNPTGITAQGMQVQVVPILCYHRVGAGMSKMNVAPARFEAQLDWLAANGYRVVRLADVAAFLAGKQALPQRAVVITFDDGYENVHRNAFPLLKKHGMPATLFIYTDFIGARDALSWPQMSEMLRSGLIDIQSHSKSHRNLTERGADESDGAYRARLEAELRQPKATIERNLSNTGVQVRHLAFPYGDANDPVLELMQRLGYELGVTVNPGGNPFYAAPLLLKRVMIFGDHDLDEFKARLQGRRAPGRS